MTNATLSSVALHVVGQYNEAGKTLVSAYRSGAQRLLDGSASRTAGFLIANNVPMMDEQAKARLIGAQEKVNGFLADRLAIDTGRVVAMMDGVAGAGSRGIEAVAGRAARVESPIAVSMLDTLARLNLPVANVSARIADSLVEGAKRIDARVGGSSADADIVEPVLAAKARKTVRRAVRRAA